MLIVVDTLRADHLSQYGYPRATSVALDTFAHTATQYRRCYAPASWTTPSIASLLTGLQPARHGAQARGAALSGRAATLAELLRDCGWSTVGVSYNHNVTGATDFDQGFASLVDCDGSAGEYDDISQLRDDALRLVRGSPRPLFLYLQPMNVHGPYRTPEERRADLTGRRPGREFAYSGSLMDAIMKEGRLERRAEVTDAIRDSHRDQYDAAVRYTIDQIALLFDELRGEGLYDDALIVLTADHGEELFDHQGFGHGYSLHRELLHVPLWIKLPRQAEARVVDEPVALTDVMPTILELAGLDAPAGLDGRSLAGALRDGGAEVSDDRVLLAETRWPGRFEGCSVQAGQWKLVHVDASYDGRRDVDLLFDLAHDPFEQQDVAALHPDVVERLSHLLEQARRAAADGLPAEDADDRLDRARLDALGYGD